MMSRAAQELGVVLDLEASPAVHLAMVMAARWEWIWRGVRFGVHTAFWILLTHYELNLDLVSRDGLYEEFTEEDLQPVCEETRAFAETLSSKYEEEALPNKDGEN